MKKNLGLRLAAAFLWALTPASARAVSLGLGSAVAKQGANIANKVVPPPLPSCGGSFQLFTQPPITDPNFIGLTPLAGQNTQHTLPEDHMYLNVYNPSSAQLLYAPSNGWVVQVFGSSGCGGYSIVFSPCAEVALSFMGVPALSPALAAAVAAAPAYNTSCGQNENNGCGNTSCVTNLQYPVQAGQALGSGVFVDFGPLQDSRINLTGFANPARHNLNRGFCPLSYFKPNALPTGQWPTTPLWMAGDYVGGTWNGTTYVPGTGTYIQRTTAPLCGTIVQDIPGTAQGDWYAPGSPETMDASYLDENNQMALIHDSVFLSTAVFSIGPSSPLSSQLPPIGIQATKGFFSPPMTNGTFQMVIPRINVDFSLVTSDGNIYCYDTFSAVNPPFLSSTLNGYIILLQLTDPNDLRIEAQNKGSGANCTTTAGTWAFSPAAVVLQR
jgi:hypothetical protein